MGLTLNLHDFKIVFSRFKDIIIGWHDHMERRQPVEIGLPIRIGEDCWLGDGVIVCPGVTIGNRVIVGAGSVVTHDIPDDIVVTDNPAKIIKTNK